MRLLMLLLSVGMLLGACRTQKSGCPANGKAVGAERILSGDPKDLRLYKSAPKFDKSKL